MKYSICNNFIKDIEKMHFCCEDYLALLCGSSLMEEKPRDIDIFIYVKKEEDIFIQELFYELLRIDTKVEFAYVDTLKFFSIKYNSVGVYYSIHVVSMEKLFSLVQNASLVETYVDINVFDVKLYSQTVYRKWIMETEYLIGNIYLKEALIYELKKKEKPIQFAKQKLVTRIRNNIAYFQEKVMDDIMICNIIAGQIFNNLVNYCYLINNVYYGTVKYIKKDLQNFKIEPALCKLTINIMESLNIKSINEIFYKFICILNYIE